MDPCVRRRPRRWHVAVRKCGRGAAHLITPLAIPIYFTTKEKVLAKFVFMMFPCFGRRRQYAAVDTDDGSPAHSGDRPALEEPGKRLALHARSIESVRFPVKERGHTKKRGDKANHKIDRKIERM